jgi:hypothetical protein
MKIFSARKIIALSVAFVFGAFLGAGIATYWLVKDYRSFSYMLDDVHVAPINIQNKRLQDVAKELAAEIKQQKGIEIRYIFSPPNLADEMPLHFTDVRGNGYYAVLALGDRYRCRVELVGDRVILLMRSEKSTPTPVE